MTLKAIMAGDKSVFMDADEFGVDIRYSSKDGSIVSASITAILSPGEKLSQADYGACEMMSVIVAVDDVPSPAIYDTFVYSGTSYTVRSRNNGDLSGFWELVAEADQRQKPRNV